MSRKGNKTTRGYGPVPPPNPQTTHVSPNLLLAQADALCRLGRLGEAEALARSVLSSTPREHAALHILGIIARGRGEHEAAIDFFRRAIMINGRVSAYHGNLGNAYLEASRLYEAARCYQRALALDPRSALAHFGLGIALIGQQNYAAGAKELETAVKFRPGHSDTHLNLGIALTELGRFDEAVVHCRRAVALSPQHAGAHLRLGIALRATADLRGARGHLARAVELNPKLADAHYQLGITLHALKLPDDALRVLEQALALRPEMVEALEELGGVLTELQRFDEALSYYERALSLAPRSPTLHRGIGRVLYFDGRFAEARSSYARALELEPDCTQDYVEIGRTYQSEGQFEQAIAFHEKAISIQPNTAEAHYSLAMMRPPDHAEARVRQLEKMLALEELDVGRRVALHFALAKIYDATSNYDAAFRHFKVGNDLRRIQHPYEAAEYTAFVDRIIATFGKYIFAAKGRNGSASDRPVFVVGMMRSGTSLVEQILASHPQIHGHGELEFLRETVRTLPQRLNSSEPYPECVASLDAMTARSLAEAHLARLERDGGEAIRSIDKMPHNFARLGLITLLFPRAKLIHCMRDRLDICVSCYFQYDIIAPFAHDLKSLGRFYQDYERLMQHWYETLPSPILDVPYEALVADPEGWTRKLLDFVGLPWDQRCLGFYETQRAVFTPSFWQVRQPIYASSVGRWRHYKKQLGPLFNGLGIHPPIG
jgi:tetratricopeptide (TPR) repeat protein